MLGTIVCLALVGGASMLTGAAILFACGWRSHGSLAPAVGLGALCAVGWWGVRLPGEGITALLLSALACAVSAGYLLARRGEVRGAGRERALALAVALAAVALGALPFVVEGRFGILGTGLNPDMSQHLFAADRLADGSAERLIDGGYPLGPHAAVVAITELGPRPVQAFNGLTLAGVMAACLAPLSLLRRASAWRAVAGALCIGLAYLVAASLVQGAFKETLQALFLLAFAIGLGHLAAAERAGGERPRGRAAALPLAVLAIGSVYVYSFPGLLWIGGAAAVWVAIELALRRAGWRHAVRTAALPAAMATALVAAAVAPELPRIVDFASFETFDPDGEGLGNLFDRLSPLEALGIWPSGDFRVEPGDGAAPAALFYLGGAAALAALGFGLARAWRAGWRAPVAALAAATALWAYALVAGTPYQEAKALVLAAPLVALVAVRALAAGVAAPIAAAFLAAAGGSSLLVLANGQVGPAAYEPELAELRPQLGPGSTVVEAPRELLADQHGRDYLVWELRGNRVCVRETGSTEGPSGAPVLTVALDDAGAVVPAARRDPPGPERGEPCPFIPDGARADPAGDG